MAISAVLPDISTAETITIALKKKRQAEHGIFLIEETHR